MSLKNIRVTMTGEIGTVCEVCKEIKVGFHKDPLLSLCPIISLILELKCND